MHACEALFGLGQSQLIVSRTSFYSIYIHYYRNVDLSQLGNLCCPGFPTGNARPGQKGCPFVPGLETGTKSTLLSRLVLPTGTKGPFFLFLFSQLFFYFDYTFTFQLNLCIGIQCVRSPLIYTYI